MDQTEVNRSAGGLVGMEGTAPLRRAAVTGGGQGVVGTDKWRGAGGVGAGAGGVGAGAGAGAGVGVGESAGVGAGVGVGGSSGSGSSVVRLNDRISFANDRPIVLIGGMNVIEGREVLMRVAERFMAATEALRMPFVFKASFDKANRSSLHAFRGPGLEVGLRLLEEVKASFGLAVITDVHEPGQASTVAEVADILQIPAFLARQTDLVTAVARTGAVVHVKKPQFLTPDEMRHIIAKCAEAGNGRVLLGERGTSFGYNNLVVDMLGMDAMKPMAPVVFDVTHALQKPGGRADSADGRAGQAAVLARAGVAVGIAGLFVEAHPEPERALCDGPCALPLADLPGFLEQVQAVDWAVKAGAGPR